MINSDYFIKRIHIIGRFIETKRLINNHIHFVYHFRPHETLFSFGCPENNKYMDSGLPLLFYDKYKYSIKLGVRDLINIKIGTDGNENN